MSCGAERRRKCDEPARAYAGEHQVPADSQHRSVAERPARQLACDRRAGPGIGDQRALGRQHGAVREDWREPVGAAANASPTAAATQTATRTLDLTT